MIEWHRYVTSILLRTGLAILLLALGPGLMDQGVGSLDGEPPVPQPLSLRWSLVLQAQDASAAMRLGEVDALAREYSPELTRIRVRFERVARAAEVVARPANPALGWNVEFLDEGGQAIWEHAVFLGKSFRLPGFRRSLLGQMDSRVRGAELERDRQEVMWLADARHGFVQVALAEAEVESLNRMESLVDRIRSVARARAAEGELSMPQLRLLEMGEYQLRALLSERVVERDRLRSEWATRMGLSEVGSFSFDPEEERGRIVLPQEGDLLTWLADSPAARADRQALEAARRGISVEEGRRWPEMDLLAGYRQMTPQHRGFVLGAAVPLPLRDGNRAAIQEARAGEREQALTSTLQETGARVRGLQLLRALEGLDAQLEGFPPELGDPESFFEALVALYDDGAEPLSGVISSLTLLADTYRTWFEQLDLYFGGLFELEALTGQRLLDS
ncbi:MAG: TolC family protein [Gemmatimonadales bacterium]|nr:MAG: TolC family protein [Gemmatimonadales bacterium]